MSPPTPIISTATFWIKFLADSCEIDLYRKILDQSFCELV